ncbi:MAG: type domain, partial [Myxococcales bacterium]|nr:type domain [Myxococcales bacterium]
MWRWVVTLRVWFVAPVFIASLCALGGGCSELLGVADITAATDGSATDGPLLNNFCDRASWRATASRGDGPGPFAGIDGNLATRWSSLRGQDGTDWYQVDFGGPVKLTNITLNNTQVSPYDYP